MRRSMTNSETCWNDCSISNPRSETSLKKSNTTHERSNQPRLAHLSRFGVTRSKEQSSNCPSQLNQGPRKWSRTSRGRRRTPRLAGTFAQSAVPEANHPWKSQKPPTGAPWNQRRLAHDSKFGLTQFKKLIPAHTNHTKKKAWRGPRILAGRRRTPRLAKTFTQ